MPQRAESITTTDRHTYWCLALPGLIALLEIKVKNGGIGVYDVL
jgi:hypothetical protein